jgi:ArsR family transcriptional regulator
MFLHNTGANSKLQSELTDILTKLHYSQKSFRDIFKPMTAKRKTPIQFEALEKNDVTFNRAAEIFRVMSAPMRLRIMSSLCAGEKNVSELLEEVDTTQSNMSQHLSTLFQAGILEKRRDGVQIYYAIANPSFVDLCRAVCSQIAIESALTV